MIPVREPLVFHYFVLADFLIIHVTDIELDSTGKPVSTSVNEPKENSDTDEAEESRLNIQGDFLGITMN